MNDLVCSTCEIFYPRERVRSCAVTPAQHSPYRDGNVKLGNRASEIEPVRIPSIGSNGTTAVRVSRPSPAPSTLTKRRYIGNPLTDRPVH